jgi:hypothetical protein
MTKIKPWSFIATESVKKQAPGWHSISFRTDIPAYMPSKAAGWPGAAPDIRLKKNDRKYDESLGLSKRYRNVTKKSP